MKKLILLSVVAFAMMSCEKTEVEPTKSVETEESVNLSDAKFLGEWEMYRDDRLESVIDKWTGTEWTYKDQWFSNKRADSRIFKNFKEDGTFIELYATVETAKGTWGVQADGRYYFDYTIAEDASEKDKEWQKERRYITVHCDNTYSIEVPGEKMTIEYYRTTGTEECNDQISYNVD